MVCPPHSGANDAVRGTARVARRLTGGVARRPRLPVATPAGRRATWWRGGGGGAAPATRRRQPRRPAATDRVSGKPDVLQRGLEPPHGDGDPTLADAEPQRTIAGRGRLRVRQPSSLGACVHPIPNADTAEWVPPASAEHARSCSSCTPFGKHRPRDEQHWRRRRRRSAAARTQRATGRCSHLTTRGEGGCSPGVTYGAHC